MSTEDNLSRRVDQLETRIEALEDIFSNRLLDREQNHAEAKEDDARTKLNIGDSHRIFIRDVEAGTGYQSRQGVGKIEGIVTFVEEGGVQFEEKDTVRAKITDVKPNAAEAYAIENLG